MIDFNNCLEKGLLRKIPASRDKALQSIIKARELLNEAKLNIEDERLNSAVIMCYMALFHTARAILFKDGYREKSHECIIRYLEEKYAKEITSEKIAKLDLYKSERTHTQYDVSYSPTEDKAEEMIEFAERFIETVSKII